MTRKTAPQPQRHAVDHDNDHNSTSSTSNDNTSNPGILTIDQAAKLIGVATATLYGAARRGKLPGAFRIGGRILVNRTTLQEHMEGRQGGAA